MAETGSYVVENITKIAVTEKGEYATITLTLRGGQQVTLAFPARLYQGLMASVLSAGTLLFQEHLKILGSDQAVIDALGIAPFKPTDFEIAAGKDHGTGLDAIVLRLKQDKVPMIDVVLDSHGAQQIGEELTQASEMSPPSKLQQ